jgi:hypothetical protein
MLVIEGNAYLYTINNYSHTITGGGIIYIEIIERFI